jgi:transcriptional regulator with XRE-family HTH domain
MLIDIFGDWLKRRRELSEIRQMDSGDFDRIASELRVSPGELDTLVRQGPHAADELPKLLRALGIDQADLARTEPMVLRDMERVCALCHEKRQCDRDLAAGTSAEHYEGYCLNATTINALARQSGQ